jgi:hypothetical protein
MKPSELFGVVVRSVGLLLVLSAMWTLPWGILGWVAGGPTEGGGIVMTIFGLATMLLGIWLLRGASGLAAAVYANEPKNDQ